MTSILLSLRPLIAEQLLSLNENCSDDDDLYQEGLDSMALMQLILLLEQEFDICLAPSDLGYEHFQSMRSIATLIFNKQKIKATNVKSDD